MAKRYDIYIYAWTNFVNKNNKIGSEHQIFPGEARRSWRWLCLYLGWARGVLVLRLPTGFQRHHFYRSMVSWVGEPRVWNISGFLQGKIQEERIGGAWPVLIWSFFLCVHLETTSGLNWPNLTDIDSVPLEAYWEYECTPKTRKTKASREDGPSSGGLLHGQKNWDHFGEWLV